jgi:hypothetical protein
MDTVDVTRTVENYAKGKTWDCPCGHGIGTEYDVQFVKCESCGEILEDERAGTREPPETEDGQMTLGAFS